MAFWCTSLVTTEKNIHSITHLSSRSSTLDAADGDIKWQNNWDWLAFLSGIPASIVAPVLIGRSGRSGQCNQHQSYVHVSTLKRDISSVLFQCRANVCDAGPTLKQHRTRGQITRIYQKRDPSNDNGLGFQSNSSKWPPPDWLSTPGNRYQTR